MAARVGTARHGGPTIDRRQDRAVARGASAARTDRLGVSETTDVTVTAGHSARTDSRVAVGPNGRPAMVASPERTDSRVALGPNVRPATVGSESRTVGSGEGTENVRRVRGSTSQVDRPGTAPGPPALVGPGRMWRGGNEAIDGVPRIARRGRGGRTGRARLSRGPLVPTWSVIGLRSLEHRAARPRPRAPSGASPWADPASPGSRSDGNVTSRRPRRAMRRLSRLRASGSCRQP